MKSVICGSALILAFCLPQALAAQPAPRQYSQFAAEVERPEISSDVVSSLSAAGRRLVRFSGKATDAASQPVSGIVGITFAIYDEQTGGAPLWQETQNVTVDANGHYAALLGMNSETGVPSEVFSGDSRWLGFLIHSPGAVEEPRVLLVSVPYALRAEDSEMLGGKPASAYLTVDTIAQSQAAQPIGASSTIATPNACTGYIPTCSDTSGNLQNSTVTQASMKNSSRSNTSGIPTVATLPTTCNSGSSSTSTEVVSYNGDLFKCASGNRWAKLLTGGSGSELYAEYFPGADISAKIIAALAALPTDSSGYQMGIIHLPASHGGAWSQTVTIMSPKVSLIGTGSAASAFACTVDGDCIRWYTNPFTILQAGTLQGFTLTGSGTANGVGIHSGEIVGAEFKDLVLNNFTGALGAAIWLENAHANGTTGTWTERNLFEGVHLNNCTKGLRLSVSSGNPSYGYNRFLDLRINLNAGQTGISIENNSELYNSTLRATVNSVSAANIIGLSSTAEFQGELHLFGEGTAANLFNIASTAHFTAMAGSDIAWVGSAPASKLDGEFSIQGGPLQGIATHNMGENASTSNYAVTFQSSIYWNHALRIASTDMNLNTACGMYDGNNMTNAPAALGTGFVHWVNLCSNDSNYLTQIAYDMTGGNNNSWIRNRTGGTWSAWAQQVQVSGTPTAGAGVCWKTSTTLGTCTAGKWPNCSKCN